MLQTSDNNMRREWMGHRRFAQDSDTIGIGPFRMPGQSERP